MATTTSNPSMAQQQPAAAQKPSQPININNNIKPKANPATMRLHRDFIRKMSWVEAMMGGDATSPAESTSPQEGAPKSEFALFPVQTPPPSFQPKQGSPQKNSANNSDSVVPSFKSKISSKSKKLSRKKYELKADNYDEYKQDQEFFQKKLVAPQQMQSAGQKELLQEMRSLENLAREQSDVVICYITEVLLYIITCENSESPYRIRPNQLDMNLQEQIQMLQQRMSIAEMGAHLQSNFSNDTVPSVAATLAASSLSAQQQQQQQQEKKSFFSLSNLKNFIKKSLRKNSGAAQPPSSTSSTLTTPSTASSSMVTPISIPLPQAAFAAVPLSADAPLENGESTPIDENTQNMYRTEIRNFLQRVISKVPVDPRLHVVGLMYFDRFVNALRHNPQRYMEFENQEFLMDNSPQQGNGNYLKKLSAPKQKQQRSGMKKSMSASALPDAEDKKVNMDNFHRFFAMCIVLASKMWEDRFYSNLSYYELFNISSVSYSKFNESETFILNYLNFELHVTYDSFRNYIEHYSKILNTAVTKSLAANNAK